MKLKDKPKHKAVVVFIHDTFGGKFVGRKSKSSRIIVHDSTVEEISKAIWIMLKKKEEEN